MLLNAVHCDCSAWCLQAEDWACLNFSKKPDALAQLIFDMEAFGIDDFKNLVFGECLHGA